MLTGLVPLGENRHYAVINLETPVGFVKTHLYPGSYIENYWDTDQNGWFIRQYIEQLDQNKDQIVGMFNRLLHYRAPLDIVLTCTCDDELICHRHILKRWLAEHIEVLSSGEITGALTYLDTPTRLMVNIPVSDTLIEDVKFLIGCQFILTDESQLDAMLLQMRYHPCGPIINATGKAIATDMEVVEAADVETIRKLLWEPIPHWLPCKESNSELDDLYRAARRAV